MNSPKQFSLAKAGLLLLFLSIILLPVALTAQAPEWVHFTSGHIDWLADEGNYLWIGTGGGGLVKLDKRTGEFVIYASWNSGLPDNDVEAITIDGSGNKWIGTHGGLAKFDGTNWTVYNWSNSPLPSNEVYCLGSAENGLCGVAFIVESVAKFLFANVVTFC